MVWGVSVCKPEERCGERMLRVAGVQLACKRDKDYNVKRAMKLLKFAASKEVRIVCFPQLFHTHWFPAEINQDYFALAEDEGGTTLTAMREIAAREEMVLICPIFEKAGDGRFFNTAFVIDADGEIAGRYRKVHIPQFPLWEERSYFERGDLGFPVVETRYAKIGVLICWDNFFPEAARILGLGGAEILFSPTANAFLSHQRWKTMIMSHAVTNGYYAFRVNRVGVEEKQTFYGMSFCVAPTGELLGEESGKTEGLIIADIELKEVMNARNQWPVFKDRQPQLYRALVEETSEGEAER